MKKVYVFVTIALIAIATIVVVTKTNKNQNNSTNIAISLPLDTDSDGFITALDNATLGVTRIYPCKPGEGGCGQSYVVLPYPNSEK